MHILNALNIGQNKKMMKMNSRIGLLIAAMVLSLSTFAASVSTDRTWYLAGEAMQVNISVDDALIA